MYKYLVLCLALIGAGLPAESQIPAIYSIDRSHAPMGDVVTIHGANFGTDPTAIKVLFGGTAGEIILIQDQLLEVSVPAGATSAPLSIVNVTTGQTGYYSGDFHLNFQGEHGISTATFETQTDFQSGAGLYDLCVCDFDGDGKPDVATASTDVTYTTLMRNTSTPGSVSFETTQIPLNIRTMHVRCGDLDGDGLPDLILTETGGNSRVILMRNRGDMSFFTSAVSLSNIQLKQLAIADLNNDGRPEIVVTDVAGNTLRVLPNQSSVGSISFGDPITLEAIGASTTDAVSIADLDNDGYPEVLTSQYQTDTENLLYIFPNRGGLKFDAPNQVLVGRSVGDIRWADLNGDARPELILVNVLGSVSVYPNKAGTGIDFNQPQLYTTASLPVSVDIADFDGDGKPDLAIGSLSKQVTVLNNTSSGTNISFSESVFLPATYLHRHVRTADFDGDGKPDIAITSIDDNTGVPIPSSKVSVFRNTACMVPVLSSASSLEICSGTTVTLEATKGGGVSYQWYRNGTPIGTLPDPSLEVGTAGTYTVEAQSNGCARISNPLTVTVSAPGGGIIAGNPNPRSNSPVCVGNSLILEVDNIGATAYRWRGPGGFVETVTSTVLERSGFATERAGRYTVEVLSGTCVAATATLVVEGITVADFSIVTPQNTTLCHGDVETLTLTPTPPVGFDIQWYSHEYGILAGLTSPSVPIGGTDTYYAIITPSVAGCLPRQTGEVTITSLSPPVADFTVPAMVCTDTEVSFISQSTGDPAAQLSLAWSVNDDPSDARHTFTAPGLYLVKLDAFYEENSACRTSKTESIEVVAAASPQILAEALALCDGASTTLIAEGEFASVQWTDGIATAERTVNSPGTYAVTATDANGCKATAQIDIESISGPELTVTANPPTITPGQKSDLLVSGADTYVWMPGKSLNDSTISNPIATPQETTVYTVSGETSDGCVATATITVHVSHDRVAVSVPVLFSPNGDTDNETLVVEGIENYPDCMLQIYDRNGRKVYGTTGYQNNWNGTTNGSPLPEGVYFYVFACPGKRPVTGSVTLVR